MDLKSTVGEKSNKTIIITQGNKNYAFSKSVTNQLDYSGNTEDLPQEKPTQCLVASPYFSASYYSYLPKKLAENITISVWGNVDEMSSSEFAFLTHVGALLSAVENNDSLLVAELIHRRYEIFSAYIELTKFIIKPIALQALFSWVFGRFCDSAVAELNQALAQKTVADSAGVVSLLVSVIRQEPKHKKILTEAAQEKTESIIQKLIEAHNNTFLYTTGLVGANFQHWNEAVFIPINKKIRKIETKDLVIGDTKAIKAREHIWGNLPITVQAEPYNPHDNNAIAVYAQNPYDKSLMRAGYLRKTGTALLRTIFNNSFTAKAALARIGNYSDGQEGLVIRVEFEK